MSIILRSAAEAWGLCWPPDVARVVNGRRVTWGEVHQRRRERQERALRWKRAVEPPRIVPCYIWTFYVPGWLYAGWHCYVVTRLDGRQEDNPVNFHTGGRFSTFDGPFLADSVMHEIPMGLLPIPENWERWMAELARRYPRHHPRDPRKAGSRVGWLLDGKAFSLAKPVKERSERR